MYLSMPMRGLLCLCQREIYHYIRVALNWVRFEFETFIISPIKSKEKLSLNINISEHDGEPEVSK